MQIKDLKPKNSNVDIVIDVIDVGESREFQKFGKSGSVATAVAKDETGDIKLTLWNDDINKVKAGDKVHIINGYVNEWQGEMQLTTGRLGKLEVVSKSSGESEVDKNQVKTSNATKPSKSLDEDETDFEEESIEDEGI